MKVAVIGSRDVSIMDLGKYLPAETEEIISGGARGVDFCANLYAKKANIKLTEIYPDYKKFGKAAPIIRNNEIIERADLVLAFWDGKSRGTKYVIERCKKVGKPIKIYTDNDT